MATGKQQVIPAATATQVAFNPTERGNQRVVLTNSAAAVLNVGGPNVSATVYGVQLAVSAVLTVDLVPNDGLYVYSTPGATVGVLSSP